ncbi:MAG: hypothetical protein HKN00_00140 [Flavobacteriaceae bacterium]|nr:hypothetical protein [Bacteroidia bacterium]MBT8286529.1 hypothetical protein [Bacteroidia bacterium]NNF73563.1 hypothetical protein [Flavobacteriaceae bacterium]NNK73109.1 hypothetical protein [Flavobacteriaceae bacterium]
MKTLRNMERIKIKEQKLRESHPTIRFIPDKNRQTDGELLVYNDEGQLKFRSRVQHFNPMELGMTHYCCDTKMVHCIPSDHLCDDDDLIEVWI